MDSIYFRDPLGFLCELSSYRFEPPVGMTHVDVLMAAHRIRVERGDPNIAEVHLADAIESLTRERRDSLSKNRGAKNPYAPKAPRKTRGKERAKERERAG